MARAKKNGTYLNVRIEKSIYEQLNEICEDAGQTKTIVVERALDSYFCDYREKQRKLNDLGQKK
ncbi:RepB family protein [Fusibacter bizertensis]